MQDAEAKFSRFLTKNGFSCRANMFDLRLQTWPNSRCGLYAWLAEDGSAYLGQSVDVRTRLIAHQRAHGDLQFFGWKALPRDMLDAEERRFIASLEKSFTVRNIKHAASTGSKVPYDMLSAAGVRPADLTRLRKKAKTKFETFTRREGSDQLLHALGRFVEMAVPDSWLSEGRFWNVSILRDGLRFNAGQQEVFTVAYYSENDVEVRLLCPTRLDFQLTRKHYETRSREHFFTLDGFNRFTNWGPLQEFVVWLMRHTTPLTVASHVPQCLDQFRQSQ